MFPSTPSASALNTDEHVSMSNQTPAMNGVGGLGALFAVGGHRVLTVGLGYAQELERVI